MRDFSVQIKRTDKAWLSHHLLYGYQYAFFAFGLHLTFAQGYLMRKMYLRQKIDVVMMVQYIGVVAQFSSQSSCRDGLVFRETLVYERIEWE